MYRRLGRNGSDDRIDWRNGQTLSRDMRSRPRGRLQRTNENLGLNNKLGRLGRNWSDDRIGWCNGQTLSRDVILRPRGRLRRTEDNLGLDDKLRWTYDTGCIEGFSRAENCIENAMKITNSITKFYILKSVIKVKVFWES